MTFYHIERNWKSTMAKGASDSSTSNFFAALERVAILAPPLMPYEILHTLSHSRFHAIVGSVRVIDRAEPSWNGPVAQWLEQGTHNPLVVGSNPTGPILLDTRS